MFVAVQDSCTYAGTKLCLNDHYLCETFCLWYILKLPWRSNSPAPKVRRAVKVSDGTLDGSVTIGDRHHGRGGGREEDQQVRWDNS